jgi:hypothetical protein
MVGQFAANIREKRKPEPYKARARTRGGATLAGRRLAGWLARCRGRMRRCTAAGRSGARVKRLRVVMRVRCVILSQRADACRLRCVLPSAHRARASATWARSSRSRRASASERAAAVALAARVRCRFCAGLFARTACAFSRAHARRALFWFCICVALSSTPFERVQRHVACRGAARCDESASAASSTLRALPSLQRTRHGRARAREAQEAAQAGAHPRAGGAQPVRAVRALNACARLRRAVSVINDASDLAPLRGERRS